MGSAFSVVASVAILRSTFNEMIPDEVRGYIWSITRRFSTEITMVIKESHDGSTNRLFKAVVTYLDGHALSNSVLPKRLTVGKNENVRNFTYGLERNSEIVDVFQGVTMKWKFNSDINSTSHFETRWYELKFHKMHAELVKKKYLVHVLEMAKMFKDRNRIVRFHTIRHDRWSSSGVNLDHPMTFGTLVMDGDLKETVLNDLDCFRRGKEYYRKIGKVWKRGYLLYGPPGTGKSSLIAAMANYMNYDIYNLNLSVVTSDSSLEYLLLHVPNRSILVVEDIDCSIKLQNRESQKGDEPADSYRGPQVTLAGLLNAIDGLLCCCGDEKITVFTTNYKDRIDPALLRAGRMDRHINLSYCTFSTFKQLAANYLDINDHDLYCHIEKLMEKVKVSPAEVAGELMKAKGSKTSLEDFITYLESKESQEEKSSTAPPLASNVDGNRPEPQENGNNISKSGVQDQSSHTETEAADMGNVGGYSVKAEFANIIKAIFSKHGDIAANSCLQSKQCRSSLLEIVCRIIQKLQKAKLKDLKETELKSMLSELQDLESMRLEVGWLRKRLDEIVEAMRLFELIAVSEKLSDTIFSTEVKLNCIYNKSLVEGLI